MARLAREENEALKARLDALEGQAEGKGKKAPKDSPKATPKSDS
jgi:BMFP domain-containing protein YqiC